MIKPSKNRMERLVESQTVPERLESPINPKIPLLILGLVIAFELYVTSLPKGEADTLLQQF